MAIKNKQKGVIMQLSKCICGTMGRPGTKCRICSRNVPELKVVKEVYIAPIVEVSCCDDGDCETCNCKDEEE